ncbi:hypothetical protein ACFGVR_02720 [Mucilaginibacter sp. AW1-3]
MIRYDSFPIIQRLDAWQISIALFFLMLFCIWIGSIFGKRRLRTEKFQENPANSTIFGAVFGLLAFLLAFTFSMSGNRYDARQQASIAEGNDIGTAILRADLFPDTDRIAFRSDFKNYLQARIDNITGGIDVDKVNKANSRRSVYAAKLWSRAMRFSKQPGVSIVPSNMMVPALNAMFDSATKNTYSELLRVPQSIVIMLFLLSLVTSFFVGYISVAEARFDWFIATGFCFLSALVIYTTLDLDRPRRGLIRLNISHQAIISLMDQFK